ncbi:bifunctional farnesyl-diphosphate farnesyltransferase/squalene synthase [Mortierella antarctica]|nr:bifunctional farnesyl-diphosphate farnesyltransferase/squalene synthase [Mortierella antarctica]
MASFFHPSEVLALLQYKISSHNKYDYSNNKTRQHLYYHLQKASHSYSSVIQDLDDGVKDADDMTIAIDVKVPLLKSFHEILYKKGWTFQGNGPNEKDRQLLIEYDIVIDAFLQLRPEYQAVIAKMTRLMGDGMALHVTKGLHMETIADYDHYCHVAAGLVGWGLNDLFIACGYDAAEIARNKNLSDSVGICIQKIHICSDFLEDLRDGRQFWPREIWSQYVDKIEDLTKIENKEKALHCLSHVVCNALGHVCDVLEYLHLIRSPPVFRFCSPIFVVSFATLHRVHSNPQVFVKDFIRIRKGEAAWLKKQARDVNSVMAIFRIYARRINEKTLPLDPHANDISALCTRIEQTCAEWHPKCDRDVKRQKSAVLLPTGCF